MRFLLDQNVEARIATFLRDHGHDATRIAGEYPAGISDQDVLAIAQREQRILTTNDKDYGDLIFQRQLPHAGVILLRLPLDTAAHQKVLALERLLISHADQLSRFLVVTPHGVRTR